MRARLALLVSLALTSCGELVGDPEADVPAVDPATREKVVADVLSGLKAAFDETGPQFYARLPAIKDESAKKHGFADWQDFKARLHAADPSLETEIAGRITSRMRELAAQAGG